MQQPDQTQPAWNRDGMQEFFSDVFQFNLNAWTARLEFGSRAMAMDEIHSALTQVRMPLSQAKALALMLLRAIRTYEQKFKVTVELPEAVLEELNIPLEDWKRFTFLGESE